MKKKLHIIFFIVAFISLSSVTLFFFVNNDINEEIIVKPILQRVTGDSIATIFDTEFINLLKVNHAYLNDSIIDQDINFISKKVYTPKNNPFPALLLKINTLIKGSNYSIVNTQVSKNEEIIDISIGYNGVVCNKLHIEKNSDQIKNVKVAIVVTDFGLYDVADEIAFLRLPYKLNISVTPHFPRNELIMEEVDEAKHEILLNMPMEPKVFYKSSTKKVPSYILKNGLLARYNEKQIENKLDYAYKFFYNKKIQPKGMTHLRGFKILRDYGMSKQVLDYCAYKKNYFLYTGNKEFDGVEDIAYKSGVDYYKHDETIDKYGDKATTKTLLYRAVKKGTKKGVVIILVSPKKSSIAVLEEELEILKNSGVNFVFISSIKN